MVDFGIYHVILIGLGQESDLHLPLQCISEFVAREKSNSSVIMCVRMVILSRYTPSHYIFQALEGRRRRSALHPLKGPCSTYLFSS